MIPRILYAQSCRIAILVVIETPDLINWNSSKSDKTMFSSFDNHGMIYIATPPAPTTLSKGPPRRKVRLCVDTAARRICDIHTAFPSRTKTGVCYPQIINSFLPTAGSHLPCTYDAPIPDPPSSLASPTPSHGVRLLAVCVLDKLVSYACLSSTRKHTPHSLTYARSCEDRLLGDPADGRTHGSHVERHETPRRSFSFST